MPTLSSRRDLALVIHRRRRLLRALAIGLACLVAIGILRPGARQGQSVLVAARDLPAGLTLQATDLRSKVIPRDLLPLGALRPGAAILGRTITSAARQGEVITDARILSPGLLVGAQGLIVATVRIADSGTVSLLRAGDRVDVLAATSADQASTVRTVAALVLVLAVPQGVADSASTGGSSLSSAEGALVVLAVSPDVASLLAKSALTARLSVTVVG